MTEKAYLSRSQLSCLVHSKEKYGRYRAMVGIHVLPGGLTETTDGIVMLRVGPPKDVDVSWVKETGDKPLSKPVIISAAVCTRALALMGKNEIAVLEVEKEHTTLRFTGKGGEKIAIQSTRIDGTFPPCEEIWTECASRTAAGSTKVKVDVLLRTLQALRKGGVRVLRMEILEEKNRQLRLTGFDSVGAQRACGILMPLQDNREQ